METFGPLAELRENKETEFLWWVETKTWILLVVTETHHWVSSVYRHLWPHSKEGMRGGGGGETKILKGFI